MVALPTQPNKKAIAVAKDVLNRLRRKKLNLRFGTYIRKGENYEYREEGDLQDCIDEVEQNCQVCLKGALILSKARLFNALPMKELQRILDLGGFEMCYQIITLLTDVFDRRSIDLLEVTFEERRWSWTTGSEEEIESALKFGKPYKSKEGIVRGTMENVIWNKGYFKPWKKKPSRKKLAVKKKGVKV